MFFKQLFSPGTTSPLVDSAFADVSRMLHQSEEMLDHSLAFLFENRPLAVDLEDMDDLVDEAERRVRRTILQHLAVNPKQDLVASLVLVSILQDAERIGDFARGLVELVKLARSPREGPFAEELAAIAERLRPLFGICERAFRLADPDEARRKSSAGWERISATSPRRSCSPTIGSGITTRTSDRRALAALSPRGGALSPRGGAGCDVPRATCVQSATCDVRAGCHVRGAVRGATCEIPRTRCGVRAGCHVRRACRAPRARCCGGCHVRKCCAECHVRHPGQVAPHAGPRTARRTSQHLGPGTALRTWHSTPHLAQHSAPRTAPRTSHSTPHLARHPAPRPARRASHSRPHVAQHAARRTAGRTSHSTPHVAQHLGPGTALRTWHSTPHLAQHPAHRTSHSTSHPAPGTSHPTVPSTRSGPGA